jgi:hypothetical protein
MPDHYEDLLAQFSDNAQGNAELSDAIALRKAGLNRDGSKSIADIPVTRAPLAPPTAQAPAFPRRKPTPPQTMGDGSPAVIRGIPPSTPRTASGGNDWYNSVNSAIGTPTSAADPTGQDLPKPPGPAQPSPIRGPRPTNSNPGLSIMDYISKMIAPANGTQEYKGPNWERMGTQLGQAGDWMSSLLESIMSKTGQAPALQAPATATNTPAAVTPIQQQDTTQQEDSAFPPQDFTTQPGGISVENTGRRIQEQTKQDGIRKLVDELLKRANATASSPDASFDRR